MSPSLTLHPIGYIHSPKRVKFDARHQPAEHEIEHSMLELLPGQHYEQAIQDLAGFDRIWLVWWFHRNTTWRPMVLPPRGPQQRRGVFATRSPHRPNPLGLTAVRLLGVEGRRLRLGPCDLVDGTPVFDIKPYLPAYDAFPEAASGWLGEIDAAAREPATYSVEYTALAEQQAAWLVQAWQIDYRARLVELLSRDPTPHRTRRIHRRGDRRAIYCGAWQAEFTVEGQQVAVHRLAPAYPSHLLERPGYDDIPDHEAQRAFLLRWPNPDRAKS